MWVLAQLLGAVLVIAGVAWVFPPLAMVLGGVALVAVGWKGEK